MAADVRAAGADAEVPAGPVTLREVTPAQAGRIRVGDGGGLVWLDGAPGEGTQVAAGMLAEAAAAGAYRPGWGVYAIVRTADGVAVGGIGFPRPPADGRVEIGYDLVPSARGNGYATEAVRAIAAWALRSPEVEAVVARTDPGNVPSQAVLERAGFRRIGATVDAVDYELTQPPDVAL